MSDIGLKNTERLKIAIGEIVISFQFIEYELSELLCSSLNMRNADDSQRICAAMSFKQKVNLFCDVYAIHKKQDPIKIDIPTARNALSAAEEFRNSVVHSFWYVSGNGKIVWMRKKSNIATKSGLKISDGVADIRKLEKGCECLSKIRNWYLGDKDKIRGAVKEIQKCTKELSRKVKYA